MMEFIGLLGVCGAIWIGTERIVGALQELNQTGERLAESIDRLELMEILETQSEEVRGGS